MKNHDPNRVCAIVWFQGGIDAPAHAVALLAGEPGQSEEERYRDRTLCGFRSVDFPHKLFTDGPHRLCNICSYIVAEGDPFEYGIRLHKISRDVGNPSFDDICRLIQYLRTHHLWYHASDESWGGMGVRWRSPSETRTPFVVEGNSWGIEYVDFEGWPYDKNQEKLL